VKLPLQTQLLPDGNQAKKLSATMRVFNAAAYWLAGEAFRLKTANEGSGSGQDGRQPPDILMQRRDWVKIVKNFGKLFNGLQQDGR
jgi:hypothetical protein